jgi:inner membrane transporter RhtA
MVLLGAFLIQWSAALITPTFDDIGAAAATGWRFLAGAVILVVAVRPRPWRWSRHQLIGTAALGASSGFMNLCFYQSISRIHLGTAVAIEYLGPFLVSALGKRSWRHVAFVLLAAAGVLALARPGGGLTWAGALFAAGSGVGWAAYAFASHRVGDTSEGFEGLAVAMAITALLTFGFVVPSLAHVLATPTLLARLVAVGLLATVLGFGAELQALRRLSPTTVGVLLALDPAVAFLVGFVFLSQSMTALDIVGVVCVVFAGIGVTRDAARVDALAPQ